MPNADVHAIGVSCILIMIGFTYWLGYLPTVEARQELSRVSRDNLTMVANMDKMKAMQKLSKIQSGAANSDRSLLEVLTNLLQVHDTRLIHLSQGIANKSERRTFDLALSGDYANIVRLMHELGNMNQPTVITFVKILPSNGSGIQCRADLKVAFYSAPTLQVSDTPSQGSI
jgi:hypothetical protein